MKKYSVTEARANLPKIIDEVESGLEVELTRRGEPVAVVISVRDFERFKTDRSSFSAAYDGFLEKYSVDEIGVDEHFFASIRAKDRGRTVAL